MPPLGQAVVAVEGRRPPARCRSWIAVGPAEFMFSPRRWVSDEQSHERSLGAERQAESGRKSEKKKGEWPLHSGWAGPGATFSGVSLSGLSHNDCRRRLLTNRSAVRILFGEPNELATNSRSFWLAARCPGLAGNGQYCGETVALWYGCL